MTSKRPYTVEELAPLMCTTESTIRRHAKAWGATRVPGTRRWLFPIPVVAGLMGMSEEAVIELRKA
jgi:predicted transcriptional regulator